MEDSAAIALTIVGLGIAIMLVGLWLAIPGSPVFGWPAHYAPWLFPMSASKNLAFCVTVLGAIVAFAGIGIGYVKQ